MRAIDRLLACPSLSDSVPRIVSLVVVAASARFCAPPSRIRGLFRAHASDLTERWTLDTKPFHSLNG